MSSLYDTYREAASVLKTDVMVETLRQSASTYVWGFQDAGGAEHDTQTATDFGYAYGEVGALFASERLHFRPNIPDAWKRYRETGAILTPQERALVRPARTLTYSNPPHFSGPVVWTPEAGWTDENL